MHVYICTYAYYIWTYIYIYVYTYLCVKKQRLPKQLLFERLEAPRPRAGSGMARALWRSFARSCRGGSPEITRISYIRVQLPKYAVDTKKLEHGCRKLSAGSCCFFDIEILHTTYLCLGYFWFRGGIIFSLGEDKHHNGDSVERC